MAYARARMRIPPLYRSPRWQIFFAGAAIGGILSWGIFLYVYGVFHEEQRTLILKQQDQIVQLKKHNHLLVEDQKKFNEENKRMLTIQNIKVDIINHEQYDVDSLAVHSLTTDVKNDLQNLLTQNIQSVAKNKGLLIAAIENKIYKRNEQSYHFQVHTIYFDTTLEISLKIVRER
ncbi:sporulation membrane protein YtrI [Microbacteriaceae bacterium 4G12]